MSNSSYSVTIGATTIDIGVDGEGPYVKTMYEDDTFVLSRPVTHSWQEVLHHDYTHTWLYHCLFNEPSYVLYHMAHPDLPRDSRLMAYEESAVLKLSSHLQSIGR